MGRCTRIKMVFETEDPFLDNYSQELFALHGMIDSLKITPDNQVTVTLDKEFFIKILYSHIHSIRRIAPHAN